MRVFRFLAAAVITLAVLVGSAVAGDAATRAEQVRRLRMLPAEEQRRLKEALDRFNALSGDERAALRKKAEKVGIERLGVLVGRDFGRLRSRHVDLEREIDEVFRLLGGPERLASLSPVERDFIRAEATRGFQWHCTLRLLDAARLGNGFGQLAEAEKAARKREALETVTMRLLSERSDEARDRYLALPPKEQKAERARVFAEWRMRETPVFARKFEAARLLPVLEMPAEKRRALIATRVRWFQLTKLILADGVSRDALRMLDQLSADERGRVAEVYGERREAPVADRRAAVEQKIREFYGKGALEGGRPRRPFLRHAELLRERAQREPAPPGDAGSAEPR